MDIKWTSKGLSDLARLHDFLALVNKQAAAKTVQSLASCPNSIRANPRLGERLEAYDPREVRKILVGQYEMRYEIRDSTIYILRLWHTREER